MAREGGIFGVMVVERADVTGRRYGGGGASCLMISCSTPDGFLGSFHRDIGESGNERE